MYEELVLLKGEILNLTCLYNNEPLHNGPSRNCSTNTVWSRLDTPISKTPDER